MAKQTAVGWLLSELQIRLLKIKSEPDGILRETMINSFLIDAEQAEEMEKEQIKDAVLYALDEDGHNGQWRLEFAEGYYKKIYTNENNK